jgi:hypothetical protein
MFKSARILILLIILLAVGANAWHTKKRLTSWIDPLQVVIYPINGDGGHLSADYINSLGKYEFAYIEHFMKNEANRYNLSLEEPITIGFAPEVRELPPEPPMGGHYLSIIWWSLKLRYWVYRVNTYDAPVDIKLFIVYHDPNSHKVLQHSYGLEKGSVGIVNVFASKRMAPTNNVIITHELLHTLGATDKYDLETGQPLYPDGFAEPDLAAIYPQSFAEIMGGKIPLSETESETPDTLNKVIVGMQTAQEIKWIQ